MQLTQFFTFVLAFFISFIRPFSVWSIGLWLLVCVAATFRQWPQSLKSVWTNRTLYPSLLFLLLTCLSFLSATYANPSNEVVPTMLSQRLSWLIFPLAAILFRLRLPFQQVLKIYILGVFCYVVLSLFMFSWMVFFNEDLTIFHFDGFLPDVWQIFLRMMHRTYSDIAVCLAIFSMAYLFLHKSIPSRLYGFSVFVLIVFIFFVLINPSRMVLLAFFLTSFLMLAILAFHSYWRQALIVFGACLLLGSASVAIPSRFSSSVKKVYTDLRTGEHTFSDPRVIIWKASKNIDHHKFFSGYGVDNLDKHYAQQYRNMHFWYGSTAHLSSHNNYIQIYLELGGLALIVFIASLISIPLCAPANRRLFAIIVTVFYAINFITECILSRACGGLLFFFFVLILIPAQDSEPFPSLSIQWRKGLNRLLVIVGLVSLFAFFAVIYRANSSSFLLSQSSSVIDPSLQKNGHSVYRIDTSSRCDYSDGKNAYIGYRLFIARDLQKSRTFSIDCWVSPDYDISQSIIAIEGSNVTSCYDMTRKGQWQTLHLTLPAKGTSFVDIFVIKENAISLENLKGSAFFSNPRW